MQTETKKFATYQNGTYDRGRAVEVKDEQDAVAQAGSNVRFNMHEQTFAEVDGETLKGEPKNHSPYIYTNCDEILTLKNVIQEMESDIKSRRGNPSNQGSNRDSFLSACEGVIERFKAKDPSTCFIREAGRRDDYIELGEGEKVYNRNQSQIWPAPAQDVAPSVAPAP